MIGRGTRLRPDLFGPGQPKEFFYIFDYCQNLEFFSQNPETTDGALGESLGKQLFTSRLELISAIDRKPDVSTGHVERVQEPAASYDVAMTEAHLRHELAELLRQHENHLTIRKPRWNMPLTPADLGELERMLVEAGVGTSADLSRAKQESSGLGLFIRSLVGMDREAAKQAFGQFLAGKAQSANQIEFINLIIDHLTEHGAIEPGLLYESPFTDINPQGPEGIFTSEQVDDLVTLLQEIRARAAA